MADFDLSQLQGLLAQFAPSEEDRKAAKQAALLQMGLSLLGTRRGQEMDRLGYAGQNGLAQYGQTLGAAGQGRMDAMKSAGAAMDIMSKGQDFQDSQAARKVMQDFYAKQGVPGVPGNPDSPGSPGSSPAPGGKLSKFEQYSQLSQQLAAQGLVKQAEAAANMAEKFRPKLKEQKTLTQNGQRVTVNVYDDGTYQVLPDVNPDLSPLHFGSTGDRGNVGYDTFTGEQRSAGSPILMDQAQIAANKIAQGNLGIAGAHLRLAQDKAAQEKAAGGKPVWDSASGQFVIAPSAQNPTGAAVTPTGFAKPDKPLTESQSKATAYVNQMEGANQVLANLEAGGFNGKGKMQQGAVAAAGSEGIPFVPLSGMITRASAGDSAQKYANAELQWTEPVLRFLTGANAPKEEVIRNAATFFPRPGDSDAVVEQKAEARRNMEQSMRLAAGAGSSKVPERQTQGPVRISGDSDYVKLPSGAQFIGPDGKLRRKP